MRWGCLARVITLLALKRCVEQCRGDTGSTRCIMGNAAFTLLDQAVITCNINMLRQRKQPHREGAGQDGERRTPRCAGCHLPRLEFTHHLLSHISCPPATARRPATRRPAAATATAVLPTSAAFVLLALVRLASAALNIIHDCDETFNYLEPLHYFLHGSGMQTWEYSAQFALRSWLYLLLHAPAAGAPALLGLGAGRGEQCP